MYTTDSKFWVWYASILYFCLFTYGISQSSNSNPYVLKGGVSCLLPARWGFTISFLISYFHMWGASPTSFKSFFCLFSFCFAGGDVLWATRKVHVCISALVTNLLNCKQLAFQHVINVCCIASTGTLHCASYNMSEVVTKWILLLMFTQRLSNCLLSSLTLPTFSLFV